MIFMHERMYFALFHRSSTFEDGFSSREKCPEKCRDVADIIIEYVRVGDPLFSPLAEETTSKCNEATAQRARSIGRPPLNNFIQFFTRALMKRLSHLADAVSYSAFSFLRSLRYLFRALLAGVYLATLNFLSNMYLLPVDAGPKKRRAADAVSIEI